MDNISRWFLRQSATTIFFLNLLGIPFYLWLYSIITQLQRTTGNRTNWLSKVLLGTITLYPIIYFFVYISYLVTGRISETLDSHLVFHLIAIGCGFLLMLIAAKCYLKYERSHGLKSSNASMVLFQFVFYPVGIWKLQPKLKQYVLQ